MNEERGWRAPEEERSGEGIGVPFAPPGGPTGGYPSRPGPYPAHGYPAGYGSDPGFGQHQPNTKGRGLAIAALVLAGFGLLFSWIWFLNFISYLAGAVALGLGIPALVKGSKAKNIALPLAITAVSSAVVAMIMATIINLTVQYGSVAAETGTGYSPGGAVPGPMLTAAPIPEPSDAGNGVRGDEQETERPVQPGLPDRDYSADISGTYFTDLIAQPAASAGESVQVGDYTVTLAEVDLDATAEVLERDPSAGQPTHGYVLFEFRALYNGSPSGTGRPDLDFTPKFIGADARLHSVLNCSMDLGASSSDRPALAPGETGTHEICFDLPEAALGEDSRVGLRMVLADRNEDVWWRLP